MSLVYTDGAYSELLKCRWRGIRVTGPRSLAIDLPEGNYVDMTGAIRLAEMIMPNVLEIRTYCNGEPDTAYLHAGGEWRSFMSGDCL